jgi:hypothetical protein
MKEKSVEMNSLDKHSEIGNILLQSISPGAVKTNMIRQINLPNDFFDNITILDPQDVTDAVLYALSTPPHVQVHESFVSLLHRKNGASLVSIDIIRLSRIELPSTLKVNVVLSLSHAYSLKLCYFAQYTAYLLLYRFARASL